MFASYRSHFSAPARSIEGDGLSSPAMSTLRRHFSGRIDPFTSAILVFPLFITYQVGILAGARGRNGVDFVTDALIRLCDSDLGTYLLLLFAMGVGYAGVLGWLRRKGRFTPGAFVPMLLEASVYAFFMGALIQVAIARVLADDHALVDLRAGRYEDLTALLHVKDGIGGGLASAVGDERTGRTRGDVPLPVDVALEQRVHDGRGPARRQV